MNRLKKTALSLIGVLLGACARPVLADEYYCCAYCQSGNNTQSLCVVGSCMFYESQKCDYYLKKGGTYCRQTIDTIVCPRFTFSANPWGPGGQSATSAQPKAPAK